MCAGQDDEELVPAEARHHVHLTHAAPDGVGHELQYRVPEGAPVGLVVRLQPIHVDDHAGQGVVVALRALELFRQPRVQIAVIVEGGQRVVDAQLLQLGARLDDVVVQALDAQHGLDARRQLPLVEGLGHVVVRAYFEPFYPTGGVCLHRDEHHGQERVLRHALE
jgi:hypothetical protein